MDFFQGEGNTIKHQVPVETLGNFAEAKLHRDDLSKLNGAIWH